MEEKLVNIQIKSLRLRTIIGFSDWEREKLQDVVIHVSFSYNAKKAIESDEAKDAINYKSITKTIIKEVESSKFNLIESLVHKVYEIVQKNTGVHSVIVTVEKPNALRFCENVLVTITDDDEK